MFKLIALTLLAILAVLLIFAATRPNTLAVQRTASIKAPPERILPLLADFHRDAWGAWSPYETKDPDMQRTLSGSPNGVGAVYQWQGDRNIGEGRMEITAASARKVTIQLDFIKPLEAHNIAEFTFQPQAGATRVTWSMHGPANYLSKIMGVFFDMDRMIGTDFEVGLARLKAIAEQST
jgi:carbon monoxide dehydrogenase subunit G